MRRKAGSGFSGWLTRADAASSQGARCASTTGWHGLATAGCDVHGMAPDTTDAPAAFAHHVGEFQNHASIAAALGLHTDSSTQEVLLAAWRKWGAGVFSRIDGVCAVAIFDGSELVLYRDVSGLVDLYFQGPTAGCLSFSTELEALMQMTGTPRRLAPRALHEYLRFGDIAGPHTIWQQAVALPAGNCLRWSGDLARAAQVTDRPGPDISRLSFDDAVDALDARLQQSVTARLQGAQRPAVFLSGGIDSSLLCALAAKFRPDVTAVTVGFDGTEHDETPVAQAVARHLGIRHEVLRFSQDQYASAFERLARDMTQPMADPATVPTLLALDHCGSHYDAVLDGTGADESVGLMPPRHVRLATRYVALAPRAVRAVIARALRRHPRLARFAVMAEFEHPAELLIRWNGFGRTEIEALTGDPVSFADTLFFRTFESHRWRSHADSGRALLNAMPCDRLPQAMIASGADLRFPFWSAEVAPFVSALPASHRHTPTRPKRVLRSLLGKYVPRDLWDLPKHGFDFPLGKFLADSDFRVARQHLESDRWQHNPCVKADASLAYLHRLIAGDRSVTFRVWLLVALAAWLEAHESVHD